MIFPFPSLNYLQRNTTYSCKMKIAELLRERLDTDNQIVSSASYADWCCGCCDIARISQRWRGAAIAKLGKSTWVNMSHTLNCELVEVSAMISAVLLQNQAQDPAVHKSRIFSRLHRMTSPWRPFAMAEYNLVACTILPTRMNGSRCRSSGGIALALTRNHAMIRSAATRAAHCYNYSSNLLK